MVDSRGLIKRLISRDKLKELETRLSTTPFSGDFFKRIFTAKEETLYDVPLKTVYLKIEKFTRYGETASKFTFHDSLHSATFTRFGRNLENWAYSDEGITESWTYNNSCESVFKDAPLELFDYLILKLEYKL